MLLAEQRSPTKLAIIIKREESRAEEFPSSECCRERPEDERQDDEQRQETWRAYGAFVYGEEDTAWGNNYELKKEKER